MNSSDNIRRCRRRQAGWQAGRRGSAHVWCRTTRFEQWRRWCSTWFVHVWCCTSWSTTTIYMVYCLKNLKTKNKLKNTFEVVVLKMAMNHSIFFDEMNLRININKSIDNLFYEKQNFFKQTFWFSFFTTMAFGVECRSTWCISVSYTHLTLPTIYSV